MALQWLTQDWHYLLKSPWLEIALVFTAIGCGAIVGGERERREKPAGLRTLILVCLGATTFTLASYAFTTTTGDSGRVAAQIVTGIGFLGAGAILHSAGLVRGMTTAATIWATAAIGMVVGTGCGGAALGLSVLVRLVLSLALAWEGRALGAKRQTLVQLKFESNGGKARIQIEKILEDFHVSQSLVATTGEAGLLQAEFRCHLPRRHLRELANEIAQLGVVRELAVKVDSNPGAGD